jgi:beta-glucosidase
MNEDSQNLTDLRVDELLTQLTLREKVLLLSGIDAWHTFPVERLGIPSLTMTDGPHGVRASQPETGRLVGPATSFPTGVSMASSWNPELIKRVGEALAEETRALGCDILLGPCVNIVRTPLAGRNFESYSEDPFLAGQIGAAYVKGIQSKKIGTSLKHFACNNQEIERFRGSSEVDERTLREIYLSQFETIVKEANPWTVMCSYNRINGIYASENFFLLSDILKGEWDFEGAVVSDWGANHTIVESVEGGLDLEMPGPAKYYGNLLVDAVNTWQIDEADIDQAVRRILRMIIKSGKMDKTSLLPAGSINTREHQNLAREIAEEAITLLKNDRDILPLDSMKGKTIAVLGPNAVEFPVSGGGSSSLEPPYRISPLEGLTNKFEGKATLLYEQGCDNFVDLPTLKGKKVQPSTEKGTGLLGQYFASLDFSGSPVLERVDNRIDFWWFGKGPSQELENEFTVRWMGKINPDKTGLHTLGLSNTGIGRLYIDNKLVLENSTEGSAGDVEILTKTVKLNFEADKAYDIRVEFLRLAYQNFGHLRVTFAFTPPPEQDLRFSKAIEIASKADYAIIFAGMPENYETEGGDRPHMQLPGRQNEFIEAVSRVNPNTIVVLNCGSPVEMPWIEHVPAVLESYYPGLEGGNAIANILSGDVNPSGKLTTSFPKRYEDNPTYGNYPGTKQVFYGEGIFVGYRYYDFKLIEPLFSFGFGLSYTKFEYSNLVCPSEVKAGETVRVSIQVKNIGTRAGKEIVQLYVSDKEASLPRPVKELKGFTKVELKPGETKTIGFTLSDRDFSFYNPYLGKWVAEAGEFEILIGSSSRDIQLVGPLTLI